MKKNKSFISRFFSHNITLLIISFLLAFAAWFYITANTQTSLSISEIPISIELSEEMQNDGYTVFSDNEKATVQVSGNRSTLGSLNTSDILVTADTGSVNGSGDYTFTLIASKKSINANYKIESITSPSSRSVSAYVDKEKQQKYTIENQIKVSLNDNSHYANVELSQSDVIVTGPETYVNQIASIAVVDNIPKFESDTKTVSENLVFLDEHGSVVNFPYITTDINSVDATITVLPVKDVNLKVDYINAPSDKPPVTLSPTSVKVAGKQDDLDKIKDNKLSVGTLDFSKIPDEDGETTQSFEIKVPDGCIITSEKKNVEVSVDLSDYDSTSLTCDVTDKLDNDQYTAQLESGSVTIVAYGPTDSIGDLSASDITLTPDFSDKLDDLKSGESISLNVPLKFTIDSDYSGCWVNGTYTVKVNVTKKK